ncbi:phosphatidylethanolamine-binding protein 4 isoform X1 [Octopus bimaculoides]|uniref:Phosphatidylethanolamine-binding protein n=1 Tax=Octopus bimaculoides TaxID=37653 RepID=A0A0L8HLI3_OCTBM|nr:phosphatidylethanolamine-binding protein 4 isoform X1 [Octopus bimaculoides]|eukprot:XP_014771394.1 PREDICTED: phosphatidylethanolamine-binding protein 4-like isoform X1 [Octopus bimaculoides]
MIFRNIWGVFILLLFNMVYHSLAKNGSNDTMCSGQHLILHPLKLYSSCGATLEKVETQKAPTVAYPKVEEGSYNLFILIMVDPDASPNPNLYWLHWLKTNISYADVKDGIDAESTDQMVYRGPSPPSGIHRYQFFLYGENVNKFKPPPVQAGNRLFDFIKFEESNELKVISSFQYLVSAKSKI